MRRRIKRKLRPPPVKALTVPGTRLPDSSETGGGMFRDTCLQCTAKHLGQARALLLETCKGYPEHYFFAIGHLAEAEDECVMEYPGLAAMIRDQRLQLEDDAGYREVFPWPTLFAQIANHMKE